MAVDANVVDGRCRSNVVEEAARTSKTLKACRGTKVQNQLFSVRRNPRPLIGGVYTPSLSNDFSPAEQGPVRQKAAKPEFLGVV